MKTRILILLSLTFLALTAHATEDVTHYYLKIKIDDNQVISYPPGTGFVAENINGDAVLNPSRLEELKEYKIIEPITLFVFTSWNDTPDTYELSSGKLILAVSEYDYDHSTSYDFGRTKRGQTYGASKPDETYGAWRGTSNGVYMTRKRFFDYDEATGYDTSLEFNNGVTFYYRDGKVEAWQDGETLKIEGRYLIYSKLGIVKLSYNPFTKEIWYVFEKNK